MEQEIQEEPWLQCSSCHDSRFAPKPCISIISLVSVEKPNNTEGHQPFPFSPPLPSVHPDGSCFTSQQALNLDSRNRRAASSESLLWTRCMLCRVLPRKPNPFTICPSLAHAHPGSRFKRIEKRVPQEQLNCSCVILWKCYLRPEEII